MCDISSYLGALYPKMKHIMKIIMQKVIIMYERTHIMYSVEHNAHHNVAQSQRFGGPGFIMKRAAHNVLHNAAS